MANHNGQVSDTTDNLPQKYYTIMLEKIPAELKSAEKLEEYFEDLFPGNYLRRLLIRGFFDKRWLYLAL
jgi:hypothetical protein